MRINDVINCQYIISKVPSETRFKDNNCPTNSGSYRKHLLSQECQLSQTFKK